MQKRKLGELEVSALGLGCMSMSQSYGPADRAESERTLLRALDLGYTFFDTASLYGDGHNEELLGQVLGPHRHRLVLASKCGIISRNGRRTVDGSPENIRITCEQSLKRLQTETIDLYYLHRRDKNVPIEESVGALAELVKQGKIRQIGLSEVSSSTLRRAHAEHPICALQSEYSLWTRDPEYRVIEACRELGVGFVPFSPLGRGFLTGRVRDMAALDDEDLRQTMPRFCGENFSHNLRLVDDLQRVAFDSGCTAAQLALAWVLDQDENFVPIPGTKRLRHVEENAAVTKLQIPADALRKAGEIMAPEHVRGERYAENMMISLDPETDLSET